MNNWNLFKHIQLVYTCREDGRPSRRTSRWQHWPIYDCDLFPLHVPAWGSEDSSRDDQPNPSSRWRANRASGAGNRPSRQLCKPVWIVSIFKVCIVKLKKNFLLIIKKNIWMRLISIIQLKYLCAYWNFATGAKVLYVSMIVLGVDALGRLGFAQASHTVEFTIRVPGLVLIAANLQGNQMWAKVLFD